MFHRVLILALLLSFSLNGFPQKFLIVKTWNADSLQTLLPGQTGEERVNTLNRLSVSLFFLDTALSKKYAAEAMDLATRLNYEAGKAGALRNYGYINQYTGKFPEALNNYQDALSIYEKTGPEHTYAWVLYDIAKTHYFAHNLEKTLEYGNRALEIFRETLKDGKTVGDVRDTIWMRGALALTYSLLGNSYESRRIYQENLRILTENEFSNPEITAITWLIGLEFYFSGQVDSAIFYFHKALSVREDHLNVTAQKYRAMMWLGDLYNTIGNMDSAIFYQQTARKWYYEKGFLVWALCASNFMGSYYLERNDLGQAKAHYRESEKIFNEMLERKSWYRHDSLKFVAAYGYEMYFPIPETEMIAIGWEWGEWMYHDLFRINFEKGNTREALKYHILYANASDTLNKISRERETTEMQTRYESEQKERQIKYLTDENAFKSYKLRQSRLFLFGLAGLITLVILLAIAVIRHGRLREKQNSLILQQKLFRSQMNPHFIFNSLSSIHHFMINEKPVKAASYLTKFSNLIRNILQGSMEEYISLSNEIGIIENYLELQKLRFPGKFDFNIEVDEALDPDHNFIPSMITQPFVENAIEHGIRLKEQKGNVIVTFTLIDDMINIVVEDDGIGREKAGQLQSERDKDHHSVATSLIMDRIRALNRTLKKKITLAIQDLTDDKGKPAGTRVVLEVPFR
jgi:tetratricopeptide (TPR) repeat protein